MNWNKLSGITCNEENESFSKTIVFPNIATTTSVEPVMSTDGNKNNMNTNIETVDDNINPVNVIFRDENLMKFVFYSIEKLEVLPTDSMEFEVFLKSSFQSYSLNYSPFTLLENYVNSIEMIFENHNTMSIIHKKLLHKMILLYLFPKMNACQNLWSRVVCVFLMIKWIHLWQMILNILIPV